MAELYKEQIEEAVIAEQLGFGHVWTTEHHFYADAWASSILTILAAMAAKTTKIRLGTYLVILPLHNPLRIAEDAATVDMISNGRLYIVVGPGG
ncbi:MAG: LLM class flavin-dependent oxidoreductase, partial [Bradyrhizobium sp.]